MTVPRSGAVRRGRRAGRTHLGLALLLPLLLAVLAATVTLGAGPASAHAVLTGASPADGSTTGTAPPAVTLRFDENIRTPSVVVVTGPDGTRADRGRTRVVDNRVSVQLAVAGPGRYTVAYRVVSGDGHPVSGTTHFRYQGPSLNPAPRPDATDASRADAGSGSGIGAGWVAAGIVLVLVVALALALVRRSRGPGAGVGEDTGPGPESSEVERARTLPTSDSSEQHDERQHP